MNFLRNLLAAILGCLMAFGIVFIMFFILVGLLSSGDDSVSVKENSVLELKLQTPIADYVDNDELNPFNSLFSGPQGLDEILQAVAVAKDDDRIKGISLHNSFIMAGLAQTQTIRKALADFKTSGKFIYTYSDFYTQKDYYLASVADSVFINPVGALEFKGLSSEVLFFKDLQEKSGVKIEVIRHGKYKSAVEPFLENEMSDANREQIKALLQSLWDAMVSDIAVARGITEANLNIIADTLGGRTPAYAKSAGLLDEVLFYDEYETKIANALSLSKEEKVSYIGLDDYVWYSNNEKLHKGTDKIAVIFAQGEILYGEGGPDIIGQDLINKALIKAREDKKVKAVVLRINSPGGSALTSDIIWREVALTQGVKPVVVSMGDVAASGGYYIAAAADKIFAEPTTITGSIGVFGTVPNITSLAKDMGINAEQVGTNTNAVDYSLFEPMTDAFRSQVQQSIEQTYATFLDRVAQGRNISIAQADSLAQGRVWSGVDAKRIGLVDELGTLEDAMDAAALLADIGAYKVEKYPKYKSGLERFMQDIEGASVRLKEKVVREELGEEMYQIIKDLKSSTHQKGVQARMPFTLNVQ